MFSIQPSRFITNNRYQPSYQPSTIGPQASPKNQSSATFKTINCWKSPQPSTFNLHQWSQWIIPSGTRQQRFRRFTTSCCTKCWTWRISSDLDDRTRRFRLGSGLYQLCGGWPYLGRCCGRFGRGFFSVSQKDWVVVSNIFYFHPYLGKWSSLTNIFQRGWNHQLDYRLIWVSLSLAWDWFVISHSYISKPEFEDAESILFGGEVVCNDFPPKKDPVKYIPHYSPFLNPVSPKKDGNKIMVVEGIQGIILHRLKMDYNKPL